MRTSEQWWKETKATPELILEWLKKQYTGEVTAAKRILELGTKFTVSDHYKDVLAVISTQEETHALWIKQLLATRGVDTPVVGKSEDRYWKETLPGIVDFETGSAVAAHAEKMRLARIRAISNDPTADADIREVFKKILKDEIFHEKAFRSMSTPEAMAKTFPNHEEGAKILGLTK
jgi:tRNA isopentenyl-2-thiomethyl-A-37 hydroxylase MiaE